MYLAALQKVSLLDFPDKISAVVFTAGCNFSCPYCHNRQLVLPSEFPTLLPEEEVLAYLFQRRSLLDGVVITGGEPCLHKDLDSLLRKIKDLGLLIKLDTNGSFPEVLANLVEGDLVDYVAIDVKGPLNEDYRQFCYDGLVFSSVLESLRFLDSSNIDFELRTTVVPSLHDQTSLLKMGKQLDSVFLNRKPFWFIQSFEPKNCLNNEFSNMSPFKPGELHAILREVNPRRVKMIVRK